MGRATSSPTTTSPISTTASTSRPTATRTARRPSGPGILDGPHYPTREYWDRRPVAIDFYNNYITNSHDNPIEADGSMHNIRVMRNMLINHASHALCNQPTLGGPVYWIRNIAYHLPGGSTRLTNGAAGVHLLQQHDPVGDAGQGLSNTHWRNNLMLGENSAPAILAVTTFTSYTSSDYNGFRPNPGVESSFQWTAPARGAVADYPGPDHNPTLETRQFATLAEYSQATGQDKNSILVDYDIFVNVPRLDAQQTATVQKLYRAEDFDFRLKPGAAAVDRGVVAAERHRRVRRAARRISARSKWGSARRTTVREPRRRRAAALDANSWRLRRETASVSDPHVALGARGS